MKAADNVGKLRPVQSATTKVTDNNRGDNAWPVPVFQNWYTLHKAFCRSRTAIGGIHRARCIDFVKTRLQLSRMRFVTAGCMKNRQRPWLRTRRQRASVTQSREVIYHKHSSIEIDEYCAAANYHTIIGHWIRNEYPAFIIRSGEEYCTLCLMTSSAKRRQLQQQPNVDRFRE